MRSQSVGSVHVDLDRSRRSGPIRIPRAEPVQRRCCFGGGRTWLPFAAGLRRPRSHHNGGELRLTAHPSPAHTTWADDHVAVAGIFAIGRNAPYSLCGRYGQSLWLDDWGYPPIGVYLADTPSAGHDMIALDYRTSGPDGEPTVVHVDQEVGYK